MKEKKMGSGRMKCNKGMKKRRMKRNGEGNMKNEGGKMWGNDKRNGYWVDGNNDKVNYGWGDD
jgi:hypothetical protein